MNKDIDIFGKFIMENLRDVSIELGDGLLDSRFESPGHKEVQDELREFTVEQRQKILDLISYCIDGGINDFLHRLDSSSRKSENINVFVKGKNTNELTKNLGQELYGNEGWQVKFSKFNG